MQNTLTAYLDLIEGIIAAMDARDTYTAKHSERVADLAELICEMLKLPYCNAETIHIASHVHDVGKIGVPDSVLTKASKLTDEEWELMKAHSEIGYRILEKVAGFDEVAVIVRHHHERWDGNGYPFGLAGKEIPFGSRVVALADSIDAMLSDRKYRKSLPFLKCKEEIERNSGIMYDPVVAKTVLEHWNLVEELIIHTGTSGI